MRTKRDHEFTIIYDVYREFRRTTPEGEEYFETKLVKKDARFKWTTHLSAITQIREIPSKKGTPYKTKVEIYDADDRRWVTVEGHYESIRSLLFREPDRRREIQGFNQPEETPDRNKRAV